MKLSRQISVMLVMLTAGISFIYSQTESKKDKQKNKEISVKLLEIKANLMILNADGKYADDIKAEDCKIFEDGVEQKITYFAKKQTGLNVGLIIDNTGSMRTQLGRVISVGATFVSSVRPKDEVFILRFVSRDKIEIVQDWTTDKNRLNEALQSMYVEGGSSAIIDALYLSANKILEREKTDKSSRQALILITDGEERDSFYNERQLLELFKLSDTQIFTIGLLNQLGEARIKTNARNFINRISTETGGAAFFVNSSKNDELIAAIKGILNELSCQYIVGYVSTNQKRDGNARKLAVQINDGANGEKRQTFIRETVSVPEEK